MAKTISFPIDAVYIWVDGSDPVWQARRRKALERMAASHGFVSVQLFWIELSMRYIVANLREKVKDWQRKSGKKSKEG